MPAADAAVAAYLAALSDAGASPRTVARRLSGIGHAHREAGDPSPCTLGQLQVPLDAFRDYYNLIRPHRALNRRTPAEAYTGRPKASASGIPLVDGHFRVRHDKIDANGKLTLRHSSRLHHIGLGRRHAGTPVLVLVHDLHIRVLSTSGELLRDLTLDPTRDYQPQAQK